MNNWLQKNFLSQTTTEKLKFYRLLQFLSFIRRYTDRGQKIILNEQTYITVEFKLVDFIKEVNQNSISTTYQRNDFRLFFDNLQGMPPFKERFAERKYKSILFFPVVNSIQKVERGPWIIQVSVGESLLRYGYPFHFPPSFLKYSNARNLDVKLSIIESFAQENSIKKTYSIEMILNEFKKRSYSLQSKVKKDIIEEFQNLIKYKIIESRFIFVLKQNNQNIINKDTIELEDIYNSKYFYFYEIIYPIQLK